MTAQTRAWLTLAALCTTLGARVVPATAAEHDHAVAQVSHVPHLLAAALARQAQDLQAADAVGSGRLDALLARDPLDLTLPQVDGQVEFATWAVVECDLPLDEQGRSDGVRLDRRFGAPSRLTRPDDALRAARYAAAKTGGSRGLCIPFIPAVGQVIHAADIHAHFKLKLRRLAQHLRYSQ